MLLKIHPENPQPRLIREVVECLEGGGLIVYPTDTVYGIGCDIFQRQAMEALLRFKKVKKGKVNFSIICNDLSHLSEYAAQIDNPVYKLMNRCLPGPYTFILKASSRIPKLFRNNKKTVGIRVPEHPIPQDIVTMLGHPIVSASLHNEDELMEYHTDPEAIHEAVGSQVDLVIDGGWGGIIPSTVIDCTGGRAELVREGKGEVDLVG